MQAELVLKEDSDLKLEKIAEWEEVATLLKAYINHQSYKVNIIPLNINSSLFPRIDIFLSY